MTIDDSMGYRYAVAGMGRLGPHLAAAVTAAGWRLVALVSRDASRVEHFSRAFPSQPVVVGDAGLALRLADVLFLTLPDRMLSDAARQLALNSSIKGKIVVHCSGAQGRDALAPAAAAGAATAVFHPIQSFPAMLSHANEPMPVDMLGECLGRFRGISIGIESDARAASLLAGLAKRLGARPLPLTGEARAHACYHAAAVVASNSLPALFEMACVLMENAGIGRTDAREALMPLIRGTLDNLAHDDPAQALTGPVVRGDMAVIGAHLDALSDESLSERYRQLMLMVLDLAERSGRLVPAQAAKMRELLTDTNSA